MNRVELKHLPLRVERFPGWQETVARATFILFLLALGLATVHLFLPRSPSRWPEALLLLLCAAATLTNLGRRLPGQNVLLAAAFITFMVGAIETLGVKTGAPFGPFIYTEAAGQTLFDPLPWAVPLLWLVVLLNARGVARLALRPWRKTRNYGLWAISLATLFVMMFDVALQPFASQVQGYWRWQSTKLPPTWFSTPVTNFVGRGVMALLILAFVTPALINKKPVKRPRNYQPLVVWVVLGLYLALGEITHGLWLAATATLGMTVATAVFAMRGATW